MRGTIPARYASRIIRRRARPPGVRAATGVADGPDGNGKQRDAGIPEPATAKAGRWRIHDRTGWGRPQRPQTKPNPTDVGPEAHLEESQTGAQQLYGVGHGS